MFLVMHSLSGALRLLSSGPGAIDTDTCGDTCEDKRSSSSSEDTCPYCHVCYDRVPPLPHDRRRSSGYYQHGQQHNIGSDIGALREPSPRTKGLRILRSRHKSDNIHRVVQGKDSVKVSKQRPEYSRNQSESKLDTVRITKDDIVTLSGNFSIQQ